MDRCITNGPLINKMKTERMNTWPFHLMCTHLKMDARVSQPNLPPGSYNCSISLSTVDRKLSENNASKDTELAWVNLEGRKEKRKKEERQTRMRGVNIVFQSQLKRCIRPQLSECFLYFHYQPTNKRGRRLGLMVNQQRSHGRTATVGIMIWKWFRAAWTNLLFSQSAWTHPLITKVVQRYLSLLSYCYCAMRVPPSAIIC